MKTRYIFIFNILILLVVSALGATPVHAAGILYVKSNGSGNCTSWGNACNLQTALANSASGDEIWVAAGTHKPTTGVDNSISFVLKDGVGVYGGFAGSETLGSQRNPVTRVTILSGNTGVAGENWDNSYNVVTANGVGSNTILDGFTITGGKAVGSSAPHDGGGGLHNTNSNPTITNVIFSGNIAAYGGGIYNDNSSPIITNVTLKSNQVYGYGSGGGMYNANNSNPILQNVIFDLNFSYGDAGGMGNNASSPELYNVKFIDSGSGGWGGGMKNENNSNPVLENVLFKNGVAAVGGGIANTSTNITILNATFDSNKAADGGGIYNGSGSSIITNSTFYNNRATRDFGSQVGYGGGIFNVSGHNSLLVNATFSSNYANGAGAAIWNTTGISSTIQNSVLWGNSSPQGSQINGVASTVTYSIVQGGYAGIGNSYSDPLLGPLADNGGFTQTMAIPSNSSAFNAGDIGSCSGTDQRGITRPKYGYCDMGAYEYAGVNNGTAPKVKSIVRASGNPTAASNIFFTVEFSEPVDGVDVADFELITSGVTGASVIDVTGSDSIYTVSVSTGSGIGTIRLNIIDNNTIVDYLLFPLGGVGAGDGNFTTGDTYTIDKTTLISILRSNSNPTNSLIVEFTLNFSESVTGVDASDLILTTNGVSGATVNSVSGSDDTYTATVDTGTGDGTIRLDTVDDDTIIDQRLNPLGGSGASNGNFISGEFYTIDRTGPTILSITRTNSSPSAAIFVNFLVTFSEPVTNINKSDYSLITTELIGVSVHSVSGAGATRVVKVNTGSGDGTIRLDALDNDTITDLAGNSLNGGFSGEVYTVDKPDLPAPILRSPRSNMTSNNMTPTLWWTAVKGAGSYEIDVASDTAFTSIEDNNTVNGISYVVITSLGNGIHYWRVRAYNASDQTGAWSAVRSFTIDTSGPSAPQLSFPLDAASSNRTPAFKWLKVSGAVLYEFQYDDDVNFADPLYTVTVRGTSRRPPIMKLGTYYWHVRAKDALGNWSDWSTTWTINIINP